MKLKNKLVQAAKLYFMLVTFITMLLMVLGLTFDSERTFGYTVFASPLIYAAVGAIPVFLPGQDRELSVKGLLIRRIIELVIIEMIILFLAFWAETIPTEKRGVVIGIAFGIFIIYVLINVLEYFREKREAKELNEILSNYLMRTEREQ